MTTEMQEALKAGTAAIGGLRKIQNEMFPLMDKITLMMRDAQVQLAVVDLRTAIAKRNQVAEELGHKGRSWSGR